MKHKLARYAAIPLVGLGLLGAGTASAHMGFWGMGNITPDEIATRHQTMFQEWATLLGTSADEVKNAWAEGKPFRDLARDKGITDEQLKARMQNAAIEKMKFQLKAFVEKGVITQAQFDKRLKLMQDRITSGKGRMGMRPHRGWFGF